MRDKLEKIIAKYEQLGEKLNSPDVVNDLSKYKSISRERKQLQELVEVAKIYLKILHDIDQNKELINDPTVDNELKELVHQDNEELIKKLGQVEERLKILLIPRDPNDSKNCIVEIRAGTGGDEAGIFVGDLFKMYQRYAERNNWEIEIISFNESEMGGFKEIIFSMSGEDVYGKMKFESGVHRVQRVPETEASGRIHTSAATVAVLPEAEEVDININEDDLRIDIFRSGGKGGQYVNKVETAVRITHIPTGIVVSCQEERSQLKNRQKAMKVLRTRLYEIELQKQQEEISSTRRSMVKTGDRSEKIRTYNYPQNRVTDHRLQGEIKNYSLRDVIDGELDPLIENLKILERTEKLNEEIQI